jgi:hypothetical protein
LKIFNRFLLVMILLLSLTSFAFCDMYAPGGILAQSTLSPTNDQAVPTSYAVATYLSGGMSQNIKINTTYKVYFRDTGIYLYSSVDGTFDIVADTILKLTSPTITITGAPTITGALTVGVDGTGHDVKFFGDTASSYLLWDESDDRLELDGADINLQDADILQFGDSQDIAMTYSGSAFVMTAAAASDSWTIGGAGHVINTTLTGTFTVGVNDTGYDVKLFGATAGAYMLWDESEDQLALVQTNASTSGVERTFSLSQTHTGIGASAEALSVVLTSNTAFGTYANAIFGKIDLSTTGLISGVAGVICGELDMPGGTVAGSAGTYAVYEAEINMPTSYSSDVPVLVMSVNTWGAEKAKFDDYGFLFDINGVTSGANDFFYDNTVGVVDGFLKCRINGATYYILLADDQS